MTTTAQPRRASSTPVDHDARHDAVEWMADTGESAVGAATRLGLTLEGLEQWCRKHQAMDMFRRLRARDPLPLVVNQHDDRRWAS